MQKKYVVTLTAEERAELSELIAVGKGAARKLAHARILLKADAAEGGPAWGDAEIAEACEVGRTTVERVRRRFVEQGLDAALVRKKSCRPPRERKIDGRAEAHLVLLACSQAPEGRKEWTMQLLADRMVELGFCASLSDETVRKTLKKTTSSRG
jgi:transposase